MHKVSGVNCCKCNIDMTVDDEDYKFKGNRDLYLICEKCGMGAMAEIRFGKLSKVTYYNEEGFDKTIKYNTSNLDGSEFN